MATKRRIAELNAEMGKVSMGQRLGNIGRGIAGLAAGATAAGMVLAQPMKKQMDYDRSLAMTSNTAFAERDVVGRIAGKAELNNAVKSAVEIGGGTKEDALGALDTMLASGAVKADTAMKLLPTLQKGATATGASTDDLAKIAISAMQQFDIGEDQIGEVLDKAVAAGQAGNFELADMARWLPQQMAAGKSAGLKGMSGFEALLVANQQARVTAGTSDEAGNNLVNLLAKLTSKETSDRFRKLDIKGKDGKDHGVDFIASMEAQKKKGKNSIEAFMSIMDQVIGQDGKYQALQKKLKSAKKEDQAQVLNEMTNLVEGTAIGQIISDRQALMALLGIRNNVSLGKEVKESLDKSEGAVDTSHAVIKDTNSYKVEDAKNNVDFAQMEGMKGFNDALGDVSVKIAEYAKAYPDLTGKIVTAGTVVAALSAAAITAAGSLRLLGGKGGLGLGVGDVLSKGAGVTGSAGGVATAANTSKMGRLAKFGRGSLPLLVFGAMLEGSENYAPYMAKQEERQETLDAATKDEKQKFYAAAYPSKSVFQYAPPVPTPEKSVWSLASGGYALGDAAKRKEIADERLKRGTLTQDEYNRRVQVPDYKAEFQQLGTTISEGMKQAVESQNFTIQNQIRVDLDGRTIAENTSENQYRELKRG